MFKSIYDIFKNDIIIALLISVGAALILGAVSCFVYLYYRRKTTYTRDMPIMLIILPAIVALLVGITNLRSAEANIIATGGLILTGLFALTRFRSDPLAIIDLTFVVIASAIGMCSGMGYVGYMVIIVLIIDAVVFTLSYFQFGEYNKKVINLRIYVPEDLNYEHAFDEILSANCSRFTHVRTRTSDGGQLFELKYVIVLKKGAEEKKLIDGIRVINGNLDVFLTSAGLDVK